MSHPDPFLPLRELIRERQAEIDALGGEYRRLLVQLHVRFYREDRIRDRQVRASDLRQQRRSTGHVRR